MVRSLLVRGALAGLLAGLAAAAVAFAAVEPRIDDAIAFEAITAGGHAAGGDELVSRDGQRAGVFLALGLAGLAVGLLYALAFAFVLGRLGPRRPRALAWALAGVLLVALAVLPALKYPASPPGVGDPDSIVPRTAWYLVLVACSLLGVVAAARSWRALRERRGPGVAALAALAAWALCAAVGVAALPGVDDVPPGYPSDVLWEFRAGSLGTQVAFWAALAAGFGALAERALRTGERA